LALIFVAQAPVAGEDASKCSVIFPRLSAEQRATQIFPLPLCGSVFCAGASDLWLVLLKAPVKSVCAAMVFHFRVLAVLELVSSLGRTPARLLWFYFSCSDLCQLCFSQGCAFLLDFRCLFLFCHSCSLASGSYARSVCCRCLLQFLASAVSHWPGPIPICARSQISLVRAVEFIFHG
jgi:hypothetical protein